MPRTIRILHVLHAFSAGGLENGIVNIVNRSPGHLIHEVCLLSRSGEFTERFTRPVVVHEMNKRQGNGVRIIWQLRELFRNRNVDIVHTRNWGAFDGVLAACFTPTPILIHGEHGRDMADLNGQIYRRNLARRLLSFRASKFVAVSRDLYTWLKQTVHIPTNKVAFIPNGVDTERFSPGRDIELRREFGIGEHEFVVGTIGRLDPVKNHKGLIDAVQLLQESGYPIRLVIVGDGPLRTDIQRSAQVLRTPHALLPGYRANVEQLYRMFDVFVLNSFAEGMSNTLLEAMASGLPIVSTAVGGNVELVMDAIRGSLILPGDATVLARALRQIIESKNLRETFGANARSFVVQNFSIQGMIETYTALYESVSC